MACLVVMANTPLVAPRIEWGRKSDKTGKEPANLYRFLLDVQERSATVARRLVNDNRLLPPLCGRILAITQSYPSPYPIRMSYSGMEYLQPAAPFRITRRAGVQNQ